MVLGAQKVFSTLKKPGSEEVEFQAIMAFLHSLGYHDTDHATAVVVNAIQQSGVFLTDKNHNFKVSPEPERRHTLKVNASGVCTAQASLQQQPNSSP